MREDIDISIFVYPAVRPTSHAVSHCAFASSLCGPSDDWVRQWQGASCLAPSSKRNSVRTQSMPYYEAFGQSVAGITLDTPAM